MPSLRAFLFSAFLPLVSGGLLTGAAQPAEAQVPAGPDDTTASPQRFDLVGTPDGFVHRVPADQLARGATLPGYQALPGGGAVLTLDAVRPTSYHHVGPALILREAVRFRPLDGGTVYEGLIRLDALPRGSRVVLAGVDAAPRDGTLAPRLTLALEGDRLLVSQRRPHFTALIATAGTVGPTATVAFRLAIAPDGRIDLTVNGTHGIYALPPAETLSFWAGLSIEGGPGRHPDPAQITVAGLSAAHFTSPALVTPPTVANMQAFQDARPASN